MRALLVGNYGIGNLGDELLREYFEVSYPDVRWRVLSAHPLGHDLPRLPVGIRSLLAFRWIRTLREMRHCDALVFGGGSLFTDIESVRACVIWWVHAKIARIMGLPVILAFQGMGPYKTRTGEWLARSAARSSKLILVRDNESFRRVSAWNLNTPIVEAFDPVFSLYIRQKVDVRSKNVLTVIPRHNSGEIFYQAVQKAFTQGGWEEVRILLMQGDDPRERKIAEHLQTLTDGQAMIVVPSSTTELMTHMAESQLVVAQRFHGALAALAAGTRVEIIPQGEGDKLSTLLRYAGEHPADTAELLRQIQKGEDALKQALDACMRTKGAVGSEA